MNKHEIISHSPEQTHQMASSLAHNLSEGMVICLQGDLGAGKTTFVKGLAEGLGIKSTSVQSPTFIIMSVHGEGRLPLYHFDLYRLEGQQDIALLGYEEFIYGQGVSVVEWSEHLGELMPSNRLEIIIDHIGDLSRKFIFKAIGQNYQHILNQF